jgi:3-oxoacyl-[acyl-carrier-protein] synthase III
MRFQHVAIEGFAHVLPPHVIPSTALEERLTGLMGRLGFPAGTIEKLTGVRERRFWDPGVKCSQGAALAARKVLDQTGIDVSEVQALVNGSVSRDYLEPATATLVAGQLGLGPGSMNFDVTNACLGFLNGMVAVANLIELGQIDTGLVVASEVTREGIDHTIQRLQAAGVTGDDFRNNFASLTLGSGAVACVLRRAEKSRSPHRLTGGVWRADTDHNDLCVASHLEMRADAHGLLVHGVDCAVATWPLAAAKFGWAGAPPDEIIFHQVGLTHFVKTFERLGLPLDRALVTFPYLGNTGPVSVPITLSVGVAQGRIQPGQKVALFGVGSGLGSLILEVQW